jgi:soluble lytic murein transglycosylase-like protein
MLPVILILGGVVLYATTKNGKSGTMDSEQNTGGTAVNYSANPWNLPDVDAYNQGGNFNTTYDEAFQAASGATSVPFALIKAHAIRESSLKPGAYRFENAKIGASYGLMQVLWVMGSNRFAKYGYPDSELYDGSELYDPETNAYLGACIIRDNLNWLKSNLRDAVNAYNTGKPEAKFKAPHNYTDDVINYYNKILGVQT